MKYFIFIFDGKSLKYGVFSLIAHLSLVKSHFKYPTVICG